MNETDKRAHPWSERYMAEKMQEKIHAVSTRLKRGGLFVESGTSLCYCDKLLTPGFWDLPPCTPPHPPPPPHRMAELSDSRSRCLPAPELSCFCKTWDTARPGLGTTFGWARMNLLISSCVDSLYKQLETTARDFIRRSKMIRILKDWALQRFGHWFSLTHPFLIFMCCILLKDFEQAS